MAPTKMLGRGMQAQDLPFVGQWEIDLCSHPMAENNGYDP